MLNLYAAHAGAVEIHAVAVIQCDGVVFCAGTDGTNSNGLPKRRLRIKSPAIFRSAVPAALVRADTGAHKFRIAASRNAERANRLACPWLGVGMMIESEHGHSEQWPWHPQNRMSSTTSLMRAKVRLANIIAGRQLGRWTFHADLTDLDYVRAVGYV